VRPGQGRTLDLQAHGRPLAVATATGRECGRSRLAERIAAQLDDLMGMLDALLPDDCTVTVHAQLDEQGQERPFIQLVLQVVVDPMVGAKPWPAPRTAVLCPLIPPDSAVRERVEQILAAPVNATQLRLLRDALAADGTAYQGWPAPGVYDAASPAARLVHDLDASVRQPGAPPSYGPERPIDVTARDDDGRAVPVVATWADVLRPSDAVDHRQGDQHGPDARPAPADDDNARWLREHPGGY
jgi:hypothetical protein